VIVPANAHSLSGADRCSWRGSVRLRRSSVTSAS
jgi:hypothetical protein